MYAIAKLTKLGLKYLLECPNDYLSITYQKELIDREAAYELAQQQKEDAGKYSIKYHKNRDKMNILSGEIYTLKSAISDLQSINIITPTS